MGNDFRIGVEEDVFNPTYIAVWADSLASVAKWVSRAGPVFFRLWQVEELESLSLKGGHELQWDSMIDQLEKAVLFAGPDDLALGI